MSVTTQEKRTAWDYLYRKTSLGATFLARLQSFQDDVFTGSVASGQSVAQTSTPVRSVSFFKGDADAAQKQAQLATDLLDLYDLAKAYLGSSDEALIYVEGKALLKPQTEVRSDFSPCFAD